MLNFTSLLSIYNVYKPLKDARAKKWKLLKCTSLPRWGSSDPEGKWWNHPGISDVWDWWVVLKAADRETLWEHDQTFQQKLAAEVLDPLHEQGFQPKLASKYHMMKSN